MRKSTMVREMSLLNFIFGSAELGLELFCTIYYGRQSFMCRERTNRQFLIPNGAHRKYPK